MILMLAEERQHVVPAPAGKPELAPVIVVGRLPAHIDHGVDRGGAADHLAAGIVEAAAVEAFLRLGLEHPVRARIADGKKVADRDVKPDPVVHAAGFEQQHAHAGIGRQSVRQHAAGRARADDDVVVLAFDRGCSGHAVSFLDGSRMRKLPRTRYARSPCGKRGTAGLPPPLISTGAARANRQGQDNAAQAALRPDDVRRARSPCWCRGRCRRRCRRRGRLPAQAQASPTSGGPRSSSRCRP